METVLRNVKDIIGDDRRSLEHVVGSPLQDNQQVMIHVLDIGVIPSEEARRAGMQQAAAIAERGRANAAAQGVTSEEVENAINEAIHDVRHHRST